MMPPQSDKLSILRAVLANLAGSGAIPTDAFGQTALSGQSAPNLTNRFGQTALGGSNSPSSMAAPSGFDATMRGIRLPTEPGFDATMRDVQRPKIQASQVDPSDILRANVPSGDWYQDSPGTSTRDTNSAYGHTALGGNVLEGNWQWDSPTTQFKVNDDGSKVTRTVGNKTAKKPSPEALRSEGASDRTRPAQASGKATPKTSAQASAKPAPSGSSPTQQQEKASSPSKPAPVAQAEPSGEALSYFRKNKSSAGWDALGTAVSLVQQSLKPEKGGLKSRAEYDRLLRGSDNFKKLDGNEQQRVRQAFAQWMNEQTIFKGKA
jgi:hypothetical protein